MREPEHVAGARHDDFPRTLDALQEDSRGFLADQFVFLGSQDQRGDVDLLQLGRIVRLLDRAYAVDIGLVRRSPEEQGATLSG